MKIHLRKRKQSKNGKVNLFLEFYKGYEIKKGKTSALRNYKSLNLFIYEKLKKPFNMFWVTEFTNYDYNTHNHLLLKGDIAGDVNYHLKSKSLIGEHVQHLPYEKSASMYVAKFICDTKTNWGIVKK